MATIIKILADFLYSGGDLFLRYGVLLGSLTYTISQFTEFLSPEISILQQMIDHFRSLFDGQALDRSFQFLKTQAHLAFYHFIFLLYGDGIIENSATITQSSVAVNLSSYLAARAPGAGWVLTVVAILAAIVGAMASESSASLSDGETALVYAGANSNFKGMGQDFYEKSSAARKIFDETFAVAFHGVHPPLSSMEELFAMGPEDDRFGRFEFAGEQIFLTTIAINEHLKSSPLVRASRVATGLSLGFFSAMVTTGVLSL